MQEAVDETGDWVAVSTLAERYGVSRQAIHQRLAKYRDKIPATGEGKSLRIHAPTYAQLVAETLDPAQELRNRNIERSAQRGPSPEPTPLEAPPEPSKFNDAAAREKNAKAELAEMQLAERRGELVPAREIEAAAFEVLEKIAQRLASMKAQSGRLYSAAKGGEEAHAIALQGLVNDAIADIAADMKQLASRASAPTDQVSLAG
jgi:hypothetical protein